MIETKIKTHLIIDNIEDQYSINWCGKIKDSRPLLKDGCPVFAVIGNKTRVELNTMDPSVLEKCAKRLTAPKGREATTLDSSHIYLKEENGNEKLMCVVTHTRVKHFIPISDKVGYV